MELFGLTGLLDLVGVGAAAVAGTSVGAVLGFFASITGGIAGGIIGGLIAWLLPPYGIVAMSPIVAYGVKSAVAALFSWLITLFIPH